MTDTQPNDEIQVEMSGPIWLKLATVVADRTPEETLTWFTDPDLLRRWWGDTHEIDPVIGGKYVVGWPHLGKTMPGQVIRSDATELVFSWSWVEEPELPVRVVMVRTTVVGTGTRLEIVHGPYRATTEDEPVETAERAGHLEGWLYFLPKLREAMATISA